MKEESLVDVSALQLIILILLLTLPLASKTVDRLCVRLIPPIGFF